MPAQSAPNMALWRGGKPYRAYGHLLILKPTVVFQARVNMNLATYPLTSITFDTVTTGSFSAIRPGMTLMIGSAAGGYDLGRQRVRASATSTVIPVGRSSRGFRPGELNVTDNAYITVLDLKEAWAKIPFITQAGVSFKDETAFSAGIAQPPVANGGPAVAQFVGASNNITVNFTAANSRLIATSGTLTHAWNFKDGTPSTAATTTVTGVVFPTGFRYVELTTSDGTRTHTTNIPVYAAPREGVGAPIPVQVSTRVLRPEGQSVSFELRAADVSMADYPPGTLVIYFEEEYYGPANTDLQSLAGYSGRENIKFVGWLDTEPTSIRYSEQGGEKLVTLQALDVAGRLAKLPGFGQRIHRNDTPTNWQEMANCNLDRYLHHLLHWHSTALEVAPFKSIGFGGTYPFVDLGNDGGSLYAQVDERAQAVGWRLTCASYGELNIITEPQRIVEPTATVIATIADTDWSEVSYTYLPPQYKWVRGSGILASSVDSLPAFAVAPGPAPGQGPDEKNIPNLLLSGRPELYSRIGKEYARANPQTSPFTLQLAHGGDIGIEPAVMEWVKWQLSAAQAAQRGLTIPADTRFLPLETSITLDGRGHFKTVTVVIEREVASYFDAQPDDPPTPNSPVETPPDIPNIPPGSPYPGTPFPPLPLPIPSPIPPVPPYDGTVIDTSGQKVLVATADTLLLITNFKTAMINSVAFQYVDITPTLAAGEEIVQAIWAAMGGADAYVLASDGTAATVYYSEDALAGSLTSWFAGEALLRQYVAIRKTQSQGKIEILGGTGGGGGGGSWSHTFDFTTDPYDEFVTPIDGGSGYTWVAGLGWKGHAMFLRMTFSSPTTLDRGCWDLLTNQPWQLTLHESDGGETNASGSFACGAQHDAYTNPVDWIQVQITEGFEDPSYIQQLLIEGTGDDPLSGLINANNSNDYGETFTGEEIIGMLTTGVAGFDTQKVGSQVLANVDGQTRISDGGALYADYGDPRGPGAIWIGRYRFQTTAAGNDDDWPDYLLFASDSYSGMGSGQTMWRITDSGYTPTDITPFQSGVEGKAVSPNCVVMPWRSGYRAALIGEFNGTRRLKTSTNVEDWTDRGVLSANAHYLRMRNGDLNIQELYIADGNAAKYSPDFGATLYSKALPISGIIVSIEVLG